MCRYRWQWYRPCHGSNQRQRSTDGAARAVLLRQIFVNSNRACHRVFGAAEEPVRRPCISRWNRSSSSAATPRVPNASTRPPASSIAKGILSRLWHISATTGASASLSLKQRCRRPRGRQTIARPGRSAPALRSARAMGQAPRVPAGDTRLRLRFAADRRYVDPGRFPKDLLDQNGGRVDGVFATVEHDQHALVGQECRDAGRGGELSPIELSSAPARLAMSLAVSRLMSGQHAMKSPYHGPCPSPGDSGRGRRFASGTDRN